MKKSFWTSGSWWAFMITLAVLANATRLSLPVEVQAKLADAIWWGLPVLLGARGARDVFEARKAPTP